MIVLLYRNVYDIIEHMKSVQWTDERGYLRVSLLRDNDDVSLAPQGIPISPPDLDRLDWDEIKRELHNLLVERGLFDYADVVAQQNGVSAAIVTVLKRKLVALYRAPVEDLDG